MTGLLIVYNECGANLPDDEFNDWYVNTQVPALMKISGITSITRLKATDDGTPKWLIAHDLSSSPVILDDSYQFLVADTAPSDHEIINRAQLLRQGVYDLINVVMHPAITTSTLPGPFSLFVSWRISPDIDANFNKWYDEEHIPHLSKIPGFQRARRYKIVDNPEIGKKLKNMETQRNYVTLYDLEKDGFNLLPEFQTASVTPWTVEIVKAAEELEFRRFSLDEFIQS